MVSYLLLLGVVFGVVAQSVIQKQYNKHFGDIEKSNYLYNFVMTLCAFLCFAVIFALSPDINFKSLPYSFGFAVTICMAIVFQVLAIKEGPLALTSLVISFALLVPTFYGVFFCNEKISIIGIVGIVLLIISLILVNDYSKSDNKITKKYLIYLTLAFLGNGFCSTFQKMHQIKFDGNYGGFFMFVAMLGVAVFNLIMLFTHKPQSTNGLYKKGTLLAGVTGICNGLVNYLMVILATALPAFIVYPTISAGSTLAIFLLSLIVYKEKFNTLQYVGYVVGIIAIVFLNI